MDNDDKIVPVASTHEQVQLFLGSALQPLEKDAVVSYDLVSEYEKTAQHKNRRVWLWLAAVFGIVCVASFCVTRITSHQNKKVSVSIDTFDDLNLRGLLNMFGRTESMYQTAERQKKSLQESMDFALEQAKQKRENDLFTVESVAAVTKADELKRRRDRIDQTYIETVTAIHASYDDAIAAANEQLELYRTQMEKFDSSKVADAQQQEAAIDSQKQLHDMEMKVQSERYEKTIADLRAQLVSQQRRAVEEQRAAVEDVRALYQAKIDLLDPVVRNQHGDEVIRDSATSLPDAQPLPTFDAKQYATGASDAFSDDLSTVQNKFDEFDYISDIVASVPQENTIPSYVSAMRNLTHQIGDAMAQSARTLQQQVNVFESALESSAARYGYDGVVLEQTGAAAFSVYVARAKRVAIVSGAPLDVQIRDDRQRVIADGTLMVQGERTIVTLKDPRRAENVTALQYIAFAAVR